MKRLSIGVAAAAALCMSAFVAGAQTVVTIEPEVRTEVRQYIVKQKHKSVKLKEAIKVGARLPATVELYEIKGVPRATVYRYAIVNDRTVLVDPAKRTIVYVYE